MKTATELDMAYAAGFFDGEGTIDIRHRLTHKGKYERFELRLQVPQLNPDVLYWFQERWGGQVSKPDRYCWRLLVTGLGCERFLCDLLPYLIGKKEQAVLALEFLKTFDRPVISKGVHRIQHIDAATRAERLRCFLRMREIRQENGIKPSGNRNPLSAAKAIQGISRPNATVGDHRGSQASREDGSLH